MECSICGVSDRKEMLVEVISNREIVQVCEKCVIRENLPILRKPTESQLREAEKRKPLFNRPVSRPSILNTNPDAPLRALVDRNYENKAPPEKKPRHDLVENFHWIIMRARRQKKITQEQLAKEVSEPEAAVKMAEQGILPESDYALVNKLESFFDIKLVKNRNIAPVEKNFYTKDLKFDPYSLRDIKISDVKKMKEEKEAEAPEFEEDFSEDEFYDADDVEEKKYSEDDY